jgi:hypothetical protein
MTNDTLPLWADAKEAQRLFSIPARRVKAMARLGMVRSRLVGPKIVLRVTDLVEFMESGQPVPDANAKAKAVAQ